MHSERNVISLSIDFFLVYGNYLNQRYFSLIVQRCTNLFDSKKCFLNQRKFFLGSVYDPSLHKYHHDSVNFCNFHKIFVAYWSWVHKTIQWKGDGIFEISSSGKPLDLRYLILNLNFNYNIFKINILLYLKSALKLRTFSRVYIWI